MKKLILSLCALTVFISCKDETKTVAEEITLPCVSELPASTPEAQGIASDTLINLINNIVASGEEFHSLMVVRHGHVIANAEWAPYQAADKKQLYSLSKSFTSSAIGFASNTGLLSVEDPIIKFFPEDAPDSISTNLANLKVKHLLSMSVGHAKDAIMILEATPKGQTWASTFLSQPVVFEPGTQFMYNSGASYMLASIVRKVSGMSAHEYLQTRLYDPLCITNVTWTENDEGNNMGASHLRLTTMDMAKFGQLYLQKGKWNGLELLSEEWTTKATSKQIENGENDSSWGYGYGYQFWMNPPGGFRADGAFGQFSMVIPEKDMVIAITSESMNTAKVMQLIWDLVEQVENNEPLPENPEAHAKLQEKLTALKYDPPMMNTTSAMAASISGKTYLLDKNEFNAQAISFKIEDDKLFFTLETENKADIVVECGINEWARDDNYKPEAHSLFSLRRIDFDTKIAASATWKDENTLILSWRFMETSHGDQLTCTFDGDKVNIKFEYSLVRLGREEEGRADLNGEMK